MARDGYAPAAMTVTLTESVVLNSKDYGSTQSFIITNIANIGIIFMGSRSYNG